MSNENKSYLEHVGGLRGVAIVLVVLFHLDGQVWAHGYVGVDVFLVITGYLLFRNRMGKGGVESAGQTLRYLWRRMVRILPPMAVLIALTLLIGAIVLHPEDEVFIGKLAYRACWGRGNVFLSHEMADYFGADAEFNPLLHLWYLSVMLQVYVLYAIGNACLQRAPKRWLIGVLAAVGAASLAWALCGEASYYATWPRIWEVLAGGLVCLLPTCGGRRARATALASLGLLAILLPALSGIGAYAPIVVAGAVLTLRYMPESGVQRVLSNAPMQWLGRISFSLYLVHMPLIVYWRVWNLGASSAWDDAMIVALALPLGWGFWWAVEKRRAAWWGVCLLWGGALLLSRAVYKTNGFAEYLPMTTYDNRPYDAWAIYEGKELNAGMDPELRANRAVFKYMHQPQVRQTPALLAMGDAARKPTVALFGDSHAMCYYPGLNEMLRREQLSGVFMTSIVIPLSDYDFRHTEEYCFNPQKEKALRAWLAAHPELKHVILCQYWRGRCQLLGAEEFESRVRRFVEGLRAEGKNVILMASIPDYDRNSPIHYQRAAMLRGMSADEMSPPCTLAQYMERNKEVLPALRRMEADGLCKVVYPHMTLAPGEAFHPSVGNTLLMYDAHHLTPEGAVWMVNRLLPQLRAALGECVTAQP